MRVAMVSEHASPLAALGGVDAGGQNVHVAALARAVARRGAQVIVYTRRDDPRAAERVQMAPGVVVQHVDAGPAEPLAKDALLEHMPAFARELVRAWSKDRPDVVHTHFWMSCHAALLATCEVPLPVVQTYHALGVVKRRYQGDKDTSPPERVAIERDIVRRVDEIVATCTDEVFEIVRMGASREKLTVVPCGVDLELFGPDGPRERRRRDRLRLLCVGRLVERKGIGNIIEALAELSDCELVVAGGPSRARLDDDPEVRRLRAIAESRGVADRVELRGCVKHADLPPLLRSADAVVCAPWYEPFGIVPLEAMACGTPVVATAVGGQIDSVVHDVTGLHVPPRDPGALAAAIGELLDDGPRRRRLGQGGVQRVRERFGWERVAAATHEAYRALAATERGRTGRFERAGRAEARS
jgi:D-inositol-3-phosphate glycosyltransferase